MDLHSIPFLKRKEKLQGMQSTELSGLTIGDTFGFDYNEMALSAVRKISIENRLQSKSGTMRKLSMPRLPFLLFCSLCCSSSQMKHKQKCFLLGRRSKAAIHTMPTCRYVCCVCFLILCVKNISLEFLSYCYFYFQFNLVLFI